MNFQHENFWIQIMSKNAGLSQFLNADLPISIYDHSEIKTHLERYSKWFHNLVELFIDLPKFAIF